MNINDTSTNNETAFFGMGCFWCSEAVFQRIRGVISVTPGYAGGNIPNPSTDQVYTGTTGHAEVVKVMFDPSIISYDELVNVFFSLHDPTQLNRQGNDVGTQYRSVIFYINENQKQVAETIASEVSPKYSKPIFTAIEPFTTFYEAEDYHKNFYNQNPKQLYCRFVIDPKLAKLGTQYTNLLT
jgi:peptide-methionine (S)-S-oxide reductase